MKEDEFKNKYLYKLDEKKELGYLKIIEKFNDVVTLVYSAKEEYNNAVVLLELLKKPSNVVKMGVSRTHGC